MTILIVYLCDQYNNVIPRPLDCIYSIGYPQHIAVIHQFMYFEANNHVYIIIVTLELYYIE